MHLLLLIEAAALLATVTIAATPARAVVLPAQGDFLNLTNAMRARVVGVPPLTLDSELTSVAQHWAARMATLGGLVHNPKLTTECSNWQRLAENIGVGPDVASIERAFENSPVHYKNLVDPQLQSVGIGMVAANGRLWVTLDFKRPRIGPPAPAFLAPKAPRVVAATEGTVSPRPVAKPPPVPAALPAPDAGGGASGTPVAPTTQPGMRVSPPMRARGRRSQSPAALGAAVVLLAAACASALGRGVRSERDVHVRAKRAHDPYALRRRRSDKSDDRASGQARALLG
jgi:hypothetical protein